MRITKKVGGFLKPYDSKYFAIGRHIDLVVKTLERGAQ